MPNGEAVSEADKVSLVNLPLQRLWRHVEIYFQNKLFSSSDHMYAYKSMCDGALNYSEDTKESQLQSQLFYKDTPGYMDVIEPLLGGNAGLTQR